MNDMFDEREVVEEAADKWWIFLLTGIGWLVFAILVFQWDYTTVAAISLRNRSRSASRSTMPASGNMATTLLATAVSAP